MTDASTDASTVDLHDATRDRYLSYALSVITSRALPDVRDGLKPVQRRILYTMYQELKLSPTGRYRKCAAVVGEVMGKYHPHGDQSIYDALVRLAQPFSLLAPLVDPQGNFGSLDGDPPAAMRYTECRLAPIAEELLREIAKDTVDYRPTYDGQRDEPIVLPAQFPQLLVNGVEGIAVGLATRIPPHNLGEVIDAAVAVIDGEATDVESVLKHIKGPDFPTGGRILNDSESLREIYQKGHGSIRVRGTWEVEREGRRERVVITRIPYAVNKAKLIERIGNDVMSRKLPLVVDVRDESTDDVRIVLDLKADASAEAVMTWLYKRTPLETTFPVHMNALVPTDRPGVCVPERLDLHRVLTLWLDFRLETIRRRLSFDLAKLEDRIHILEGFAIIFADLDEVIRIIRASSGRQDAAVRLMERFPLDERQTFAILDLRLYRLAQLEIQIVLDELEEKRAEAAELRAILGSEERLWGSVRSELIELRHLYAEPRRTEIGGAADLPEFDESAYVIQERAVCVVSRDGWVKRQGSYTDIDKIRVRDGDEVGWLVDANTTQHVVFVMSNGVAYTLRADALPATTGHGGPLSTLVKLKGGAKVIGVLPVEDAFHDDLVAAEHPEDPPGPYVVSVSAKGRIQRLPLSLYAEPSTRAGRKLARIDKGDELVAAWLAGGGEWACLASTGGNALAFPLAEANLLKSAGKGVTAMKLKDGDSVLAFEIVSKEHHALNVQTTNGRDVRVSPRTYAGSRANLGTAVIRRGGFGAWVRTPTLHTPPEGKEDAG